jgi:hypothetical protein
MSVGRGIVKALSEAKLDELSRLFGSLVFFARSISCEEGPGREDIRLS